MKEEKDYYIGLDLGTSGVKCFVINSNGNYIGSSVKFYTTKNPAHGYAEQDPLDWYKSSVEVIRDVIYKNKINKTEVRSIGICGTAHTSVLLNKYFKPIRPAILWCDQRSEKETNYLKRKYGNVIINKTFNEVNCTWTLPQILWLKENEPNSFKLIKHILVSKDYIVYRFTGELAADFSSSVSTLMVNAQTRQWDPFLIDLAGLSMDMFPSILPPCSVVGCLSKQSAQDLGLTNKVKVIVGSLDSAAELVGVGAIKPGDVMIRLGSAGGVMSIAETAKAKHGCLTYPHPIKPYWYYQAGTNSCMTSIEWVRRLLSDKNRLVSYSELEELAKQAPLGCDGLFFHPYLLGERAPYWNANARGSFIGLSINHNKSHFIRAVQEGIAFSLKDCSELLKPLMLKEIRISGGGTKSTILSQTICDIFGVPMISFILNDASTYGIALMASTTGTTNNIKQVVSLCVKKDVTIKPNIEHYQVYKKAFKVYQLISKELLPLYSSHWDF